MTFHVHKCMLLSMKMRRTYSLSCIFVRSFFALHCPLLLAEKGENFKSYFELKMENKVERVRTWWEKYYWVEKDLLHPLLFLSLAVVASWDCCLCCSCCCYWLFFFLLCKWQKRVAFFGLVVERREVCVFCWVFYEWKITWILRLCLARGWSLLKDIKYVGPFI